MCLRRYVRSYYKHNVRSFAIIVCYVQAYLFTPTISGRFTSHVPLAFILISKTKRILNGNIKNAEAAVLRRTNTGYRWSALTYFANVLRYSASICSSSLSRKWMSNATQIPQLLSARSIYSVMNPLEITFFKHICERLSTISASVSRIRKFGFISLI